jgi:GT2 family glycosyltransferase
MFDLSIIIVSYKGWDRLVMCLKSISSVSGINKEVIIVDNKSDDETFVQIEKEFPGFKFIHNTVNGGFGNGCNLGAEKAKGNLLLFLNPDTVVKESELEKLITAFRLNQSESILSCRQVNERGKEKAAYGQFPDFCNLTGVLRSIFGGKMKTLSNQKSEVIFPDWVSGSAMMMSKELFHELGGFDEDFWMYFEDVDICRRARNAKRDIQFFQNITIEHNHGGSSRVNLKTTSVTKTEVHISQHVYISKHKTGINRALIQIFLVINNLITGVLMAIPGLILFFIPKAFVRTIIFTRLLKYYIESAVRLSWISPRSVNFQDIYPIS